MMYLDRKHKFALVIFASQVLSLVKQPTNHIWKISGCVHYHLQAFHTLRSIFLLASFSSFLLSLVFRGPFPPLSPIYFLYSNLSTTCIEEKYVTVRTRVRMVVPITKTGRPHIGAKRVPQPTRYINTYYVRERYVQYSRATHCKHHAPCVVSCACCSLLVPALLLSVLLVRPRPNTRSIFSRENNNERYY
jgi:hypothetical protein